MVDEQQIGADSGETLKIPRATVGYWRKNPFVIGGFVLLLIVVAGGLFWFLNRSPEIVIIPENVTFTLKASLVDAAGVEPTTTFILKSDADLPKEAVEGAVAIEPETTFSIEGRGPREFEIIPAQPLETDVVYQVLLAEGEIAEREYGWAFQVKSGFRILGTLPRDEGTRVPTNSGIEFVFNREYPEDYLDKIVFSPDIEGRYEVHRNTLAFIPTKPLVEGTIYTVVVSPGVSAIGTDDKVTDEYTFAFETATNTSRKSRGFAFSRSFWEIRSADEPAFEVSTRGEQVGQNVNVTILQLPDAEAYTEAYSDFVESQPYWWARFQKREFERPQNASIKLETLVPIEEEESVRFIRLPMSFEKGFYVADAVVGESRSTTWFQVTDIGHYVSLSGTNTLVWIKNLTTGAGASDAAISYKGERLGTTDSDGVALVPTPDTFIGRSYNLTVASPFFIARVGDEDIVIPVESEYGYIRGIYPPDDWWDYLSFDKTLYLPTDTLRFWGIVKPRGVEDIRGQMVRIQLRDRSYGYNYGYNYSDDLTVYAEAEAIISDHNTVTGLLSFESLRSGTYDMVISLGDTDIATEYVKIEPYIKPAYRLVVEPDATAVFAGADVKFEVRGEFFEGTPVPGLKLKYDGFGLKGEIILDEEGKATITAPTSYEGRSCRYRWPCYLSMTVRPAVAEEGEIAGSTSVLVFGPRVTLGVYGEYAGNRVDYRIKTNQVVLERVAEGASYWRRESYTGSPAAQTLVDLKVTEITYTKIEIGRGYDFINKVTYPRYSYSRSEREVASLTLTTDANGEATYGQALEDGKSYRFSFTAKDSDGRTVNTVRYAYGYSSSYLASPAFSTEGVTISDVFGKDEYRIGDPVALQIDGNSGVPPPEKPGAFLFLNAVIGIDGYVVTGSPRLTGTYQESYIPGVTFVGVWFSGSRFYDSWRERLDYAERERLLNVSIKTDKERYRPGETADITVSVTDEDGRPREAEVNIWGLDEAAFTLNPEERDILADLYRQVYPSLRSRSSHMTPESDSVAELGGCFTAGTHVLFADGSNRDIEDVRVGDYVLTRAHENSEELISAKVVRTTNHLVGGYLIINGRLRVTGDHSIFVNGEWLKAGQIRIGDEMVGQNGQSVVVDSVEQVPALTRVYNFEVAGPHTYFADGLYVHNQEKGGGVTRDDLEDIALYEVVQTDADGKVTVMTELPDNITSWRLTAQAVTQDFFAGKKIGSLPVTLPFFVDVALNKTYLVGDSPIVRLRTFGTDPAPGDVTYGIDSAGLGLEGVEKIGGKSVEMPLGVLKTPGTYEIRFAANGGGERQDALLRDVNVVSSYFVNRVTSYGDLDDITERLPNGFDGRVTLTFTQQERGRLYPYVRRIGWASGLRIDQGFANALAGRYLARYFDGEESSEVYDAKQFQTPDGGFGLLPYDDNHLALSANFAALVQGEDDVAYDRLALSSYFWGIVEDREEDRSRAIIALYGLAAMREPVLVTIQNTLATPQAGAEELTEWELLNLTLALESIGAKEDARTLFVERLRPLIEKREPYAFTQEFGNEDGNIIATTLLTVLAGALDMPEVQALERYSFENAPKEELTNFERLLYLKTMLPQLSGEPVTFHYETDSQSGDVALKRSESRKLNISAAEARTINFTNVEGRVGVAVTAELPVDPQSVVTDKNIGITRRTYYVDDVATTIFSEGDLVRVELGFDVTEDHLGGSYELVDYLPSGLRAVSGLQRSLRYGRRCWSSPMRIEDQVVTFLVSEWWYRSSCGPIVSYYARVVGKGTYIAEPPRIQSLKSANIVNVGLQERITIQ